MDVSCFQTAERRKARVEIIPLIDVVFFLLATFVLFTLAMERIKVMPLTLPEGGTLEKAEDLTLFVQAREDGAYTVRQGRDTLPELIVAEMLYFKLQDYKAACPVPRVLIEDDGRAKFGAAMFALDEVRRAEIKQVSIETRR